MLIRQTQQGSNVNKPKYKEIENGDTHVHDGIVLESNTLGKVTTKTPSKMVGISNLTNGYVENDEADNFDIHDEQHVTPGGPKVANNANEKYSDVLESSEGEIGQLS